jgi:hypothetical protein
MKKLQKYIKLSITVLAIFGLFITSTPEAYAAIRGTTPPAVAYATTAGTTTIAPAYPTGVAQGDVLVLVIGMKPNTANGGTVTTPTGWTPITSLTGAGGYGATLGADTGNTNIWGYYVVATTSSSGTLTVSLGVNNVSWAQMLRFTNATGGWSVAGTTGSDTAGGNVSITGSADPGVTAGDYIIGAMTIPTDVSTPAQFSAEAFTQTGVTFGTTLEVSEPDSTGGNDIGGFVATSTASSGTGSANPTMTATAGGTNTNVRGPGIFIRIRETFQAPTVTTQAESNVTQTTTTVNGTISSTGGQDATVRGFAWGTNANLSNGDTATTTENGTFGTGAFTGSLSSLTCNTTYYSRPYATNPTGTGLGTIDSFTTSACAPTVTTQAASSITDTTATANGNITATNGASATVRGFAWGTNSALSGGDTATTTDTAGQPFGTGAFTGSLSGLTCGTTYYTRAYATNTGGDGLGSIQSFSTTACPTLDITGNVYEDEATTALTVCDGSGQMIAMSINGGAAQTGSCADANGSFTINTGQSYPSAGSRIYIWVDGATACNANNANSCATTVIKYSGTGDITDAIVRRNRLIIRDDGVTNVTNANLATLDHDIDTDIVYSVDGLNNLVVEDNIKVIVNSGDTFAPGASVTTSPSGSASGTDGDILIESGATLNMAGSALSVGGDLVNSGTLSASSNTVTFSATATGHTISGVSSGLGFVTFNGVGGGWSFSGTTNLAGVTLSNGTLSSGNNALNITGDFSINSGGTYSGSGTGTTTINGSFTGAGVVNLSAGGVEQRVNQARNFGMTSGSNNWIFNNLTFSNSHSSAGFTITTQTGGTGGITVTGNLLIGKAGDFAGAVTTLDAGNKVWTLSSTSNPFVILSSPQGVLSGSTSTFEFTGNGVAIPSSTGYNNLSLKPNGASQQVLSSGTFTLSGGLLIGDGTNAGATLATNNPIINTASTTIAAGATLTTGNGALSVTGDVTVHGTLSGSGTATTTINGNFQGIGTVNLTGGGVEQRVGSNKNFGSTAGSNTWQFRALTFSNSHASSPVTITTQTGGSGGVAVVTGSLLIGKAGDAVATTLNAGNRTWTLTSTPDPLIMLPSPQAVLAGATSNFHFTGGGATIPASTGYNSLEFRPGNSSQQIFGSGTFTIGGNLVIGNGVNAGATAATNNPTINVTGTTLIAGGAVYTTGNGAMNLTGDLTVTGTFSGSGTATTTLNGNLTGAGTVNLTGGGFEQRVSASKNFGSSSGTNAWTFNNLTFSNSHASTGFTITTQAGGSGGITVSGNLLVGKTGDTAVTTFVTGSRAWTFSSASNPLVILSSPQGVLTATGAAMAFTGNGATVPALSTGSLELKPNGATPQVLGAGTFTINSLLTVGNGANAGATAAVNNPTINTFNLTIATGAGLTNGSNPISATGDLVVNGTLSGSGSGNITVNGNITGSGTVNLTNNTFEQRISSNKSFGSSAGTNDWTFNNLTISNSALDTTLTATTGAGAGGIAVNGSLLIGKTGDDATGAGSPTVLNAGSRTWFLSSASNPLVILSSPQGVLTATSATFEFTGDGVTIPAISVNNLSLKPSGSTAQTLGSGTFTIGTGLLIGNGTNAGATAATNNPIINVASTTIASGAIFTTGNGALSITGDMTVNGTFSGSGTATTTLNGSLTGAGTVNLTGGGFEQRVGSNKNFGSSGGSNNWIFRNLTFSRSAGTPTITTQSGGLGEITVSGLLLVSKTGDGAGTTLDAGPRTWNLTNSNSAKPFNLGLASGALTPNASTFVYSGDNDGGDVTIEDTAYNQLTLGGAVAENYVPEGAISFTGIFTINTNGTLAGTQNITHGGSSQSFTGEGAINLTGGTYEQRVGISGTSNFGPSSGSANWVFNNLTFSNSQGSNYSVNTNPGSTGTITVNGVLSVGKDGDSGTTTFAMGDKTFILTANSSPLVLLSSPQGGLSGGGPSSTAVLNFSSSGTTGTTLPASSDYPNLILNRTGNTFTFAGNASTTNLTITAGTLVAPAALTIQGDYSNSGIFTHNSGKVYFETPSGPGKTLSGTMTGTSAFNDVYFKSMGGWSFSNNASTTNLTISAGAVTAPSGLLSISGNYSNSGIFTHNSGTTTINGSSNQTLSGNMIGTSAFANLEILNNTATTTFASVASTTANFSIPGRRAYVAFPASATSTLTNLLVSGSGSGNEARLWSSSPGTWWGINVPGTRSVSYISIADSRACSGLANIDASNGTNIDAGGNSCWSFPGAASPTISSASNQLFTAGPTIPPISTITVNNGTAGITAANDLRIAIATSSVNMRWDTSDTNATFGGTASGKVSNPVSYEGGGSVLVVPVGTDFANGDTLTIAGLSFSNINTANAAISGLDLYTGGPTDITSDADDDKTITIKGSLAVAQHNTGQKTNKFDVDQNQVTDAEIFAFKLVRTGENSQITSITFPLGGIKGIGPADITNVRLAIDYNGNNSIDAEDELVGGSGSVTFLNSGAANISFNTPFTATTTRNYILKATVANLAPGDQMAIKLDGLNINVATGPLSGLSIIPTGFIGFINHTKIVIFTDIGGSTPSGAGTQTGGGGGGGGVVGGNADVIGDEPGYLRPTSTGSPTNQWTGANLAYDNVNGTHATEDTAGHTQDYADFSFSIPGGNTITGIEVKMEASATSAGGTISAALSHNGGSNYTSLKTTGAMTTLDTVYTLGSPGDLWGRVWTASDLSNANFRLRLTGTPSSNILRVDEIQVKIFHQSSGGGSGGGGEVSIPTSNFFAGVGFAFDKFAKTILENLLKK